MVAVYPTDAIYNVTNFSTVASVQYNNTNSQTEFVLPTTVTAVGQILPYSDGVLQDATTYDLGAYNGTTYSNIVFAGALYASNLTLKVISVPSSFFIWEEHITTAVATFSNTTPTTIRSNVYLVNGIRTTFALPAVSNTSNKDAIIAVRSGVTQSQSDFTFPSATLGIYGIDFLEAPLANETVEIRVFDTGARKYVRKTGLGNRKADRGYSYSRTDDVNVTKFIAGYEKRRLNSRRLKRKWNFGYTNINGMDKEAIDSFYRDRNGSYESFSFDLDHINESGLATVVFESPPQITNVIAASPSDLTQNYYNVTIVLREVDD
jgi:hypothetical protein